MIISRLSIIRKYPIFVVNNLEMNQNCFCETKSILYLMYSAIFKNVKHTHVKHTGALKIRYKLSFKNKNIYTISFLKIHFISGKYIYINNK